MLEILCHQVAEGYKIPHGFKDLSYTIVVNQLNNEFTLVTPLTKLHVQNRVKTLKIRFKAIHEIVHKSGYSWDSISKKITTLDDGL